MGVGVRLLLLGVTFVAVQAAISSSPNNPNRAVFRSKKSILELSNSANLRPNVAKPPGRPGRPGIGGGVIGGGGGVIDGGDDDIGGDGIIGGGDGIGGGGIVGDGIIGGGAGIGGGGIGGIGGGAIGGIGR